MASGFFGMQSDLETQYINGFTLIMPKPSFVAGSSINLPCYMTTVEITADNNTVFLKAPTDFGSVTIEMSSLLCPGIELMIGIVE